MPPLELGEIPGDGQAQAAALGVPGGIPPDELVHELLGGDVQGEAEMFRKAMTTAWSVVSQER